MRSLCFLFGFLTVASIWLSCAANEIYWVPLHPTFSRSFSFFAQDVKKNHFNISGEVTFSGDSGTDIRTTALFNVKPKFTKISYKYTPRRHSSDFRDIPAYALPEPYFMQLPGANAADVTFEFGFNIDSFKDRRVTTAPVEPRINIHLSRQDDTRITFGQLRQRMEKVCESNDTQRSCYFGDY